MTVDELIALAQKVDDTHDWGEYEHELARGVLEVLVAEATPCGFEEAYSIHAPSGHPNIVVDGGVYGERGARWLATAILRACDEAKR